LIHDTAIYSTFHFDGKTSFHGWPNPKELLSSVQDEIQAGRYQNYF